MRPDETAMGELETPNPAQATATIGEAGATAHLDPAPDITIVFPVQTHKAEIEQVLDALGGSLEQLGFTWECILVFDGIKGELWRRATEIQARSHDQVRTIALHKQFGETVCLSSAFEHARGGLILTTPAYVQIDPHELGKLFAAIDDGADFVATWRYPRVDSRLNQIQSHAFNWVVRKVVGAGSMTSTARCASCGARSWSR